MVSDVIVALPLITVDEDMTYAVTGASVGADVGVSLGVDVGWALGVLVGCWLGVLVGLVVVVTIVVGRAEGAAVGAAVGRGVDSTHTPVWHVPGIIVPVVVHGPPSFAAWHETHVLPMQKQELRHSERQSDPTVHPCPAAIAK
jgi:hypothetical protein